MNFSQRVGLEPATRPFQKHTMDEALRNSLWNAFDSTILTDLNRRWEFSGGGHSRERPNSALFVPLWVDFYKQPLSTLPEVAERALAVVHRWFFDTQGTPWNRVYEFVEFIGNLGGNLQGASHFFRFYCNRVLERESSAYRFVDKFITPITNEEEIRAIEQAATDNSLLRPVSKHIETALKLLSDRNNPDYRNSMKESISAVEALCKIIAKKDQAALGEALDAVTAKTQLHRDLQKAFKALYGYTSDTHGIRHALKDDAHPDAEDATYLLVTCSAFVNYLVEKASKNALLP